MRRYMAAVRRVGLRGFILCVGVAAASPLLAQDPRDTVVAQAFNEFDATHRQQLLMSVLDPAAGSPRGAWPVGVQLLAQTLIEEGQDSVAAVWLRWAIRLSPDFVPDTVRFLPRVVAAHRSARDFVNQTRTSADTEAVTTWLWPSPAGTERVGHIQLAANLIVPLRVEIVGFGPIAAGASVSLAPGSYRITASAAGYDSVQVTREVVPGVTTVLEFRLPSALARVSAKAQPASSTAPPQQVAVSQKKKGFPFVWVALGAGVAGGVVALLAAKGGSSPPPASNTGGIVVKFP